ncbi:MAG TPA: hypothetical protein VHG51_10685 [Longimicrobiaceae bacterium]|nr:hypothetical protein [Longimicrobiaceae bacterium]
MRSTRSKLAPAVTVLLLAGCSGDGIVEPGADTRRYTEYQCETSPCGPQLPPSGGVATHDYGSDTGVEAAPFYRTSTQVEKGKRYTFRAYSSGNEYMERSKVVMIVDRQANCAGAWGRWGYAEDQVLHNGQPRTVEVQRASDAFPLSSVTGWRLESRHTFTPLPGASGGGYFERIHQECV